MAQQIENIKDFILNQLKKWLHDFQNFFHQTNLNIDLVRRGYAKVLALDQREHYKALQSVPAYSRLISKLIMSEKVYHCICIE